MKYYVDTLKKEEIEKNIPSYYSIQIFDSLPSTNDHLLAHPELREGSVIIANTQTKGKGRNGRSFYSPKECGIYLSVLLKPKENLRSVLTCTAMAAVSCLQAIQDQYGYAPQIKWLNDIVYQDKKLAGILCESILYPDHLEALVIGIGINVHSFFHTKELKDIAASIEDFTPIKKTRNALIAKFLSYFYQYYFHRKDFLEIYRQNMAYLYQTVTILQAKGSYKAKIIGVDALCRLQILKEDGKIDHLSSGEVSIRPWIQS